MPILIIGTSFHLYAQHPKRSQKQFDKALTSFRNDKLETARTYTLIAIQSDSINVNAYLLLSDIAAELKNADQYQWSLHKVIELMPSKYPQVYKLLGNSYFDDGEYISALKQYRVYRDFKILKDVIYIEEQIRRCQRANTLIEKTRDIEIIHLDSTINTAENEYWPFISADDSILFFTRLITHELPYSFERLFSSDRKNSSWLLAEKLKFGNNNEVNEGTLSMTADGSLFFFTACGRPDGKGSCDIYYMKRVDGQWHSPQNAGRKVNTNLWEAQPAVSSKGEMLFWSSNREGGFGGKDIWLANISNNEDGSLIFSDPVNLGKEVNSAKNDFSPFIHADDKTLYFASDGHYGLGKSDLFISRFTDSIWDVSENLGYPINSISNDNGLVVSPTAHDALFSSDRRGSVENSMDLYSFQLPQEYCPNKMGYVKGFIFDASTNKRLDAAIELTNLNSKKNWQIESDDQTGYIITLESDQNYAFNINKKGYLFYSEHFSVKASMDYREATVYNIYLQPIRVNAKLELKNIFFEFDSSELNETSIAELKQLINFMKQNPTVKIEISGHTDNVGDYEYNQILSEERAKSISLYLEKNSNKSRINYRGYGDQKPVASNEKEEGRAKNRRSELRVIAY